MNQHTTHTLRALFNRLKIFPVGDPRNVTAWRRAKRSYNAVPKNKRAAYLIRLEQEVETAEFLRSSEEAKT